MKPSEGAAATKNSHPLRLFRRAVRENVSRRNGDASERNALGPCVKRL
jgi:hypothetical protein